MERIIEKKITVTDDDIDDIMSSALRGITYWSDECKVMGKVRKEDNEMYMSEAIIKGYKLRIHDAEEDKWHTLTLTKFLTGLEMMDSHDFYEYDMLSGDQVIQYALFGKQVYA